MTRLTGWLSRQRNGLYMLTKGKPIKASVGTTTELDLYVPVGDAIGWRNMCPWSASCIWGAELAPLASVRVWVEGGRVGG